MMKKLFIIILFAMIYSGIHAKDETPVDSTMFTVGYHFRVNTKTADGEPVTDSLQTLSAGFGWGRSPACMMIAGLL